MVRNLERFGDLPRLDTAAVIDDRPDQLRKIILGHESTSCLVGDARLDAFERYTFEPTAGIDLVVHQLMRHDEVPNDERRGPVDQ